MKLFIIGGRPCSGKTTLAYKLSKKYNIDVNHLDEFTQECINHATEENQYMYRWKNSNLIELLQKEPHVLFYEYVKTYEEMLHSLLKAFDHSKMKVSILEGSILLPKIINDFKKSHEIRVCYLVTDDDFVKERYFRRDYVVDMLGEPKGNIAIRNLLERDSIFSEYINNEIEKYALPKLVINTDDDIELVFNKLEAILGIEEQSKKEFLMSDHNF